MFTFNLVKCIIHVEKDNGDYMKFFKVREHTMCFKSAVECWVSRSPILVFSTAAATIIPTCGFLGEYLFGPLLRDVSHFTKISETVTQVEKVQVPINFFIESVLYTIGTFGVLFFVFLAFIVLANLVEEIRHLKSTYDECKCKNNTDKHH